MKGLFEVSEPEKVFLTADHHFGHENIIKFVSRPFKTVDEMDQTLIDNWNQYIKPSDIVFHLGDFTLGNIEVANKYFSQLNGNIKMLCNPWHHDKRWLPANEKVMALYQSCKVEFYPPMTVLEVSNMVLGERPLPITLCHYPMAVWDRKHYGAWHAHGHSHGNHKYNDPDFAIDVGVDNMNYYPIRLDNLLHYMYTLGFVQYE